MPLVAALPVSREGPENRMRLHVLERLRYRIRPSAESLKRKVGIFIPDWAKPYLDAAPIMNGFPNMSEPCIEVSDCFEADCDSLKTLMRFITDQTSSVYNADIAKITAELYVISDHMGCDTVTIITIPLSVFQEKDSNYRIVKDIVGYIDALELRYSSM